jgi:hypothetical protein
MNDERERAHHAQAGDVHLETWKADDRYFWRVMNARTRQQLSAGEADSFDTAKIAASGAAGVEGQPITWRGIGPLLTKAERTARAKKATAAGAKVRAKQAAVKGTGKRK